MLLNGALHIHQLFILVFNEVSQFVSGLLFKLVDNFVDFLKMLAEFVLNDLLVASLHALKIF